MNISTMTIEEWRSVKRQLLQVMEEGKHPDRDVYFLHISSRGTLLFSDEISDLPLNQQWDKSIQLLNSLRDTDWFGFAKTASRIRTVYPARVEELRLNEKTRRGILDLLSTYEGNDWSSYTGLATRYEVLFPGASRTLFKDSRIWACMKEDLETERGTDWFSFAYQASDMKFLQPDKTHELKLDKAAWKGMSKVLDSYRADPSFWRDFTELAYHMNALRPTWS